MTPQSEIPIVLENFTITYETTTVNNVLYRLVHKGTGEEWLLKVHREADTDGFLLEAVAGKIVERLGVDFVNSVVGDVFWINSEGLLPDIPPGEYLAGLIKPFPYKTLHQLRKEKEYEGKVWDLVYKLVQLGGEKGFVHNDLHTGNVLYNLDTEKFVVIDLGRAYFSEADDLITPEELTAIYETIHGYSPHPPITCLQDYYRLVKYHFIEYVRFPKWDSNVAYFDLIMFDVVGLLFYLEYIELWDKELGGEVDLEMACRLWLWCYVGCLDDLYKCREKYKKMIHESWYLTLPMDEAGYVAEKFLRHFYRRVRFLRPYSTVEHNRAIPSELMVWLAEHKSNLQSLSTDDKSHNLHFHSVELED